MRRGKRKRVGKRRERRRLWRDSRANHLHAIDRVEMNAAVRADASVMDGSRRDDARLRPT